MNIYEFEWESGTDWVCAPDIKEAREFYLSHIGGSDLEGCKITKIKKSQLSQIFIIDPNEPEPNDMDLEYNEDDYCNGYKIIESFEEYLKHNNATDIVCTTEF